MKEHLTPDRIANSIMQKSSFKGTYLIVEGNSDYTLFKKFTSEEFCCIEIAFGNMNVIEVVDELKSRGYYDAIGLIDSDFRRLDGDFPANPDILMTDDHDIELMIIKSEAFETVINYHCEESKLKAFKKECGTDLRSYLINLAVPLGYLKWINKAQSLSLIFKPHTPDGKELNYSNFIPVRTFNYTGHEKMVETVINYSIPKRKINTTLKNAIIELKSFEKVKVDNYQLCNGHDICQIISLGLRTKIGSKNANAISANQIERELIFAYDSRFFRETDLYLNIKKWEDRKQKSVLTF